MNSTHWQRCRTAPEGVGEGSGAERGLKSLSQPSANALGQLPRRQHSKVIQQATGETILFPPHYSFFFFSFSYYSVRKSLLPPFTPPTNTHTHTKLSRREKPGTLDCVQKRLQRGKGRSKNMDSMILHMDVYVTDYVHLLCF